MEFKNNYFTDYLKKASTKRLYKFDVFCSWLWLPLINNKYYKNGDEN